MVCSDTGLNAILAVTICNLWDEVILQAPGSDFWG